MKRFHVNLTVADSDASVQFYTHLFAAHPTVQRPDYAKWMLDDPRVNFAITTLCGETPGLSHLGIQAESSDELQEVQARMQETQAMASDVAETACCYARGEKGWAVDPQGIAWEGFFTSQDGLETFGDGAMPMNVPVQAGGARACNAPMQLSPAATDKTLAKPASAKGCCA